MPPSLGLQSLTFVQRQALNLRDFFLATWIDWLGLCMVGGVTGAVWLAPPRYTHLFPVNGPNSDIYWPELAYPYANPIFSAAGAATISAIVPIATFAASQIWLKSFIDFSSATLGLAYRMVTATCFQVVLKKTIGGLRPHFLSVCDARLPASDGSDGMGYRNVMYDARQICMGDPHQIKNALESFPSGHATIAFAGLGYLTVYLFTHLQISSDTRSDCAYVRMLCVVAPLLLATYLTSTLVLGYHHHAYDVIFGAIVGSIMALIGYRMVYKSIMSAGTNTVPYLVLAKSSAFDNALHSAKDEKDASTKSMAVPV